MRGLVEVLDQLKSVWNRGEKDERDRKRRRTWGRDA